MRAKCRARKCGAPSVARRLCRVHYSRGDSWIRGDRANRSWDSPETLRVAMGERRPPGPPRGRPLGSRSAPKALDAAAPRTHAEKRERASLARAEADRAQEVEDRKAVERARAERAARETA